MGPATVQTKRVTGGCGVTVRGRYLLPIVVSLSDHSSAEGLFDKLKANGGGGSDISIRRQLITPPDRGEPVETPGSAGPGVEGVVDGVTQEIEREQKYR